MRIQILSTSRLSLQRWVSFVTSGGVVVIAIINLVALQSFYALSITQAALSPSVALLVAIAVVLFATGLTDRTWARITQVVTFASAGILTALDASPGDLTSLLFVVLSLTLLNEYSERRRVLLPAVILGSTYVIILWFGIEGATASVGLAVANILVLSTILVLIFVRVSLRQKHIRQEHEARLESLVAERTARLKEAVEQRDTMLQEIHHRVGNSLQLLASFVRLQQDAVDGPQRQVLKETELRVHAIADVHATLYRQHQLSHLPLSDYVGDLLYDMQVAYRGDAIIIVAVDLEIEAHIDFAISFGVILNELVTNAAKHGASIREPAQVEITLKTTGEHLTLVVRDHGNGFPEDFHPGVGTEIVDQLVLQNSGTITRTSIGGASVTVAFPESTVVRHEPIRAESKEST